MRQWICKTWGRFLDWMCPRYEHPQDCPHLDVTPAEGRDLYAGWIEQCTDCGGFWLDPELVKAS